MIDSHCHFDFAPFTDNAKGYLRAAKRAGVNQLIVPAVGEENWQRLVSLVQAFPSSIYFALGVHPLWADRHSLASLHQLEVLLANREKNCIAIGECGLDFARPNTNKTHQMAMLSKQFELAIKFDLPVILHCRKAHNEMLGLMNKFSKLRGVVHAFSGSERQGNEYIKRGFYLGIGGTITYQRANKTREAVARLSLASMLLETDAPYMPLSGRQAKPNLPKYLPFVAQELANLKSLSLGEIEQQTMNNTVQLFGI